MRATTEGLMNDEYVAPQLPPKKFGGRSSIISDDRCFRTDSVLKPGEIATASGEVRQVYRSPYAVRGHHEEAHLDLRWNPQGNAEALREAHARRLAAAPPISNMSDVDEIVFGEDKDNSRMLVPGRKHTDASIGGKREGIATVPGRCSSSSKVGTEALQWNDQEYAVFRPELLPSPGKRPVKPTHEGELLRSGLSYSPQQAAISPKRAALIASQTQSSRLATALDWRNVPQVGIHDANPQCPRCGSSSVLEAKRNIDLSRKMQCTSCGLSWEELPAVDRSPSSAAGVDHRGRGQASSLVDETVFGKTPSGGRVNNMGTNANFMVDRFGMIGNR